ncbi:MAG: response regulator, partial [Phaeodactylibacter sp.]|nr:response regulator [Phaeodactylibacter sp.]
EFRTPLTIIQGTAGQLMSKVDHTVREELKRIQRNGRQLLNLVNQMLDLAKLESGSLPVHQQQGDVIPFLKYLLESFHSLAEAKDISLHFRSEAEMLVMDYDAEKIQQIVGNLLSNAVKFTGEGGKVALSVERCWLSVAGLPNKQQTTDNKQRATNNKQHNFLSVSVSDTGIGIPEEKLPNVFNRFYQADDSATRRGEGTGIGLTLTKELVKLLGGKIEVESELNKGTTFTLFLPITNEADAMDARSAGAFGDTQKENSHPAPPGPLKGEIHPPITRKPDHPISAGLKEKPGRVINTLLIIEDNPDVTHYLSSILKNSYTLLTAPDGKVGLETAQQEMPDLILCDVMMPEMDGFEVCHRLKSGLNTSHIPIILLTAKADIDSRIEGIEQGADAYLAKPFEERELKARLKKLLENRDRLRAYYTSNGFIARKAQPPAGEGQPSPADREFFERLLAAVEDNLGDPAFSAEQLADLLFVSYATCLRKVKALTGCTVKEYIRQIRIHRAAQLLLEEPGRNIGAIAADTGFNSNTHFTREFRKVMGCTPTEYRKQEE